MPFLILSIVFAFLTSPIHAGEINFLGGYGETNHPEQSTGAWQVQYMEGLGENFAYTISYVNQGHFISHHRDGTAVALWLRTNQIHRQLTLGVGAGPMFYYDTLRPPGGAPSDVHGWATTVNLLAGWYAKNRWIYQLQGSWVKGGNSFDTLSVLAGIGYQLDAPPAPGPDLKATRQTEETTDEELTLSGGQTVVNLPGNGSSTAGSISFRQGILRYLEWSAGLLYEGKSDLIDRYGVTGQLWLAKTFFDEHMALGIGLGFYLAEDRRRAKQTGTFISEILSITASYRLSPHWDIRTTWDRIITDYDRDSDIFMGGVGYRY